MSYDIYLTDPVTHEPLKLEAAHHMRGGTYAMSGTTEAWLNITYNYVRGLPGRVLQRGFAVLRRLHGAGSAVQGVGKEGRRLC